MNTKIIELIKEHGFMFDEDLVEFAEIIIKECLNEIESKMIPEMTSFDCIYNAGLHSAKVTIKQKFNIE